MRPSLLRRDKCPFAETGYLRMAAFCETGLLSALAAIPAFPSFHNRSSRLSRLSARSRSWAVLQTPTFSRNLTQLALCEPSHQCPTPCSARSAARCAHRTPAWRLTRRSTRTRRYMSATWRAAVAARRLPCFVGPRNSTGGRRPRTSASPRYASRFEQANYSSENQWRSHV
jgi:hypothetical protein